MRRGAWLCAAAVGALGASPGYAELAPPVRAGTLAVNLAPLAHATGELRWESPLLDKLAWSVHAGGGRGRSGVDIRGYVLEGGGQLRYYLVGDFRRGLLVALDATAVGAFGDSSRGETALALGPRLGYKIVGLGGLTAEAQVGASYVRKSADGVVAGTTAVLSEAQAIAALLLGEAARATETAKLLGYGFRFFESKVFHKAGDVLADVPVWKGAAQSVKGVLAEPLAASVARGDLAGLTTRTTFKSPLIAPVKQGDVIGSAEVLQGDKVIQRADVVAQDAVEQGGFFRRVWDSIRLFFKGLFG